MPAFRFAVGERPATSGFVGARIAGWVCRAPGVEESATGMLSPARRVDTPRGSRDYVT
jgi:hypothetical protein